MALRHSCHPTQLSSLLAAQLSALPAPQQCTQMAQNGAEEPFSAICVHYCVTTGRPRGPRAAARSATVYTDGPERLREAVFGDPCTLLCPLRHHGAPARPPRRSSRRNSVHKWPRTASKGRFLRSVYTIASPWAARVTLAPQQCTQMPRNGVERPFSAICVHYCIPTGHPRPHRPPARVPRRDSVHDHEAPNIPAPGRRTSPRSG